MAVKKVATKRVRTKKTTAPKAPVVATPKHQVVVLYVEVDGENYDPPAEWDWSALADFEATVIAAGPYEAMGG
jgi:hypothetical protein